TWEQICYLTAYEREFQHPRVFDDLPDTGRPRFHQRCVGLNFDCLGNLPDIEHRVHNRAAVDLENDPRLNEGSKSGKRYFELVWTNRQVGQDIRTRLIAQLH